MQNPNSSGSAAPARRFPLWLAPVVAVVAVVAVAWRTGCTDPEPMEGSRMTQEQLNAALRRLDPDRQADLLALAQEVRDASRTPVAQVVNAWAGEDSEQSEKAMILLDELEEQPIVPLLEAPEDLPVERRVWMLRSVVAMEAELRERVAERLAAMLDDKTPVPMAEQIGPEPEEKPKERRVCDEAYMQMRLLVNGDPDPEAYYLNVDAFLDLTEDERDAEMEKTRNTGEWTEFYGPGEE